MLQYGSTRAISSENKFIHFGVAKLKMQTHCRADSRTALTADLKLVFRFVGF